MARTIKIVNVNKEMKNNITTHWKQSKQSNNRRARNEI